MASQPKRSNIEVKIGLDSNGQIKVESRKGYGEVWSPDMLVLKIPFCQCTRKKLWCTDKIKPSKVLLPHWTNWVRKTYLIFLAHLKSSANRSWAELRILCTFIYSGVRFQASKLLHACSVTPNIVLGICYVNKTDMSSKILARIWPQHKTVYVHVVLTNLCSIIFCF